MKRNIRQTLTAPLLLLAAALGTTGCSQSDDTPMSSTTVALGGEPIRISVSPKPGFTAGDDTPGTRATVTDDGTFAWEQYQENVSDADKIYVHITFNDAAATKIVQSWMYQPGQSTYTYLADWFPMRGWSSGTDGNTPPTWPVGASSAVVQAFYTDCKITGVDGSSGSSNNENPTNMTFDYTEGTGDHMIYTRTIALGENISVDFAHTTTRLVFKGLAANTAYSLNVGGTPMTYPTVLTVAGFSLGTPAGQTFTSDANGKLVICAALDNKIGADTGKLTLELMTGGFSAGTAELTAKGAAGSYKMDGYMYTVNVKSNGGPIDPDGYPDLLPPAPIAAGNTVYVVNGYWVTAPDADENKAYEWASSQDAPTMENDPCAGHGKWRMPTMKDFEVMAGWTESHLWSQDATMDKAEILSDKVAFFAAFSGEGNKQYWSSTARVDIYNNSVWTMYSVTNATTAYYASTSKRSRIYARCVQKQ